MIENYNLGPIFFKHFCQEIILINFGFFPICKFYLNWMSSPKKIALFRVCKKAGQLYKSPLRWLKLDKTGLNWTFLDKIGLFQNYFNFSTKTHSKCLKWHLNTEPNIYFGKYNIYWSSQAILLAFSFGKIDLWNKIDINLLSE